MATVESLERDVDSLLRAIKLQNEAIQLMYQKLVEVVAHTNEHHNVINDLGGAVQLLEGLLIGTGGDDEPTA